MPVPGSIRMTAAPSAGSTAAWPLPSWRLPSWDSHGRTSCPDPPVPTPAPPALTHLVHLHAFLFTAWVVLLLIQTRLWLPDASTCTFD